MAVIYHVEHGDTEYDAQDKAQGLIDSGLNDAGRRQARAAGRLLKGRGIECIYSSPMLRARQTAGIIAKIIGAKVIVRKKLKPVDIGTLAGKKNTTVKPYLEFFSSRPTLAFPDGEKFGEWYDGARKEWIHQFADHDPVIAVVSHTRDWQLLKHWQRNGLDAGPEGIEFEEPGSAQVTKATKHGSAISVRQVT
jgi:probable phosphoglycerate mutase